ncbi:porin [Desulfopila sp. IMCC35008]|uniref:porin n=1 Tax=Desulfopila sp. IMCC35008 TaxID=2653858 RepID=UPI0013CF9FBA|nr:porin [Desulfopila sp. IMCC35008]
MKKVIAAAAGLMLAGTLASAAVAAEAGVKFKGDARARYYLQNEYASSDSEDTHWNSRVRLQWTATSKGGAYAVGRFRLADATWNGTQSNRKGSDAGNLWVDKAYIGVPFGPITVEAGLTYRNLTDFAFAWRGADAVDFIYKGENTNVRAFIQVEDEYEEDVVDADGNVVQAANDADNDNDIMMYGVRLDQKFAGGWGLVAYAAYQDDQQFTDESGTLAGLKVSGAFGGITTAAEVAYQESDLLGSDDDGIGAYIEATVPVGPASIYGIVGVAQDGFVVDDDFAGQGNVMGNFSQISSFAIGGSDFGDTTWVVVAPKFKATESLTLGANLGYYDGDVDSAFEIGLDASYAVTDGASLNAIFGYVDFDEADNNPLGFGLSLEISY